MWHVRSELEDLPFSTNRVVLMLSWYILIVGTWWPWTAKKCLVHRNCPIASSTAMPFCSINCCICLNCPSMRIALILNPHAVYACITCLIDVISVFFQIEPFGISNVSSILFINTLTADWLSRRIQLFWILALSSILQFKPCTNANHS